MLLLLNRNGLIHAYIVHVTAAVSMPSSKSKWHVCMHRQCTDWHMPCYTALHVCATDWYIAWHTALHTNVH